MITTSNPQYEDIPPYLGEIFVHDITNTCGQVVVDPQSPYFDPTRRLTLELRDGSRRAFSLLELRDPTPEERDLFIYGKV